jgi:Domain of unknown function (DUF4136)
MKITHLIFPVSMIAVSAFAQDVTYNFDQSANFAKYKTYKWIEIKESGRQLDQLSEQQLKSAIEEELARKGLALTTGDSPDLLIGYQFALGQEKQFTSYSSDFGYGAGWRGGWYGGGMGSSMTTGQTYTIHVGALGLDMYDPARKQLVWRGEASKTLDPKAKPDKRIKNINKGVAKLLKNYPPKVKS